MNHFNKLCVFWVGIAGMSVVWAAETDDVKAIAPTEDVMSVVLSDHERDLMATFSATDFVFIPASIKQILQKSSVRDDLELRKTVEKWIQPSYLSIAPEDVVTLLLEKIVPSVVLSVDEQKTLEEYRVALENGDAEIDLAQIRSKNKVYCNLCVRNSLKAGHVEICGDLRVNGTIYGTVDPAVQGPQGPQGPEGPQGPQGPIGITEFGNVELVDSVYGNDSTGQRNGQPFLTINAALAVAQAGDVVWIFPGTYTESFVIPDNVSVVGLVADSVVIQKDATASTDLVTMGENSSLQNVNLRLTSAAHWQLRGVVFPGTTTATAVMSDVDLFVDNSTATVGGSSAVYGVHSNGAGLPTDDVYAVSNCKINVSSIGLGAKRGILVDGAGRLRVKDSQIFVLKGLGAGSSIGVETNSATAELTLRTSTCGASSTAGIVADISQTQGTLTLIATSLSGAGANLLGFSTKNSPDGLIWSNPLVFPAGASLYLRSGSGTAVATANSSTVEVSQPFLIGQVSVRARVAPGGVLVDEYIVQKNGIDTPLTVLLTGVQLTNTNKTESVAFAVGDYVSARVARTGVTATQDPVFVMHLY